MRRSKKSTAATASTEDIISTLPDAILSRILSYVSTKEAVATTILSKRWMHLWHHVPNLNFPSINIDAIETNHLFNEFVYSVLLTRETVGSNITNGFNLRIQYGNPHFAYNLGLPHINKWINILVKRKLEYLRLHLHVDDFDFDNDDDYDDYYYEADYILPVSIFTCKTLVTLDLCGFHIEGFDFSSNGFQFPLLKNLHFESVHFPKVRDFMLLIAGCPNLEDIHLTEFCLGEEDMLTLQEFKSLTLPKLKTAHLVSFHCPCFPVNALSTAKYLFLNTLKVAHKVNQLQRPYDDLPTFHNLTHLGLHNRWDLVVQVLHQCPKLQDLKVYKGLSDGMGFEFEEGDQENWVEPKFVPQCLLSSLTTFAIRDYTDLPSDLMLEQYILKNARILQTMTVWSTTKQPEMRRTLSMCPMASTTCQISLCANI